MANEVSASSMREDKPYDESFRENADIFASLEELPDIEFGRIIRLFEHFVVADGDAKLLFGERIKRLYDVFVWKYAPTTINGPIFTNATDIPQTAERVLICTDVILDNKVYETVSKLDKQYPELVCTVWCFLCSESFPECNLLDKYMGHVRYGKPYQCRKFSGQLAQATGIYLPEDKLALDLFFEYKDVYGILYSFFCHTHDVRRNEIFKFADFLEKRYGLFCPPRFLELVRKLDYNTLFADLMTITPERVGATETLYEEHVAEYHRYYYEP